MLVAVVGPSGVGKDSLINGAKAMLAGDRRFLFVRRQITRPMEATEDHEPVSEAEFEARQAAGGFALHWRAHELSYGLPISCLSESEAGRVVVANLSRGMLKEARRVFSRLYVVTISADPLLLAERLAGRGRESAESIARRLERRVDFDADQIIDNSGPLDKAVNRFVTCLINCADMDDML